MDISNLNDFVTVDGQNVVTDSRSVARVFKKQHKDILRIIRGMVDSKEPEISEHAKRNFTLCFEINDLQNGKRTPYFKITKDGLSELAMGFTGDSARIVRIRFIGAFNAMVNFIENHKTLEKRSHDLEIREIDSKISATFGSYLMLTRKKEKRLIERERLEIENEMQYQLFNDPPAEAGFLMAV